MTGQPANMTGRDRLSPGLLSLPILLDLQNKRDYKM